MNYEEKVKYFEEWQTKILKIGHEFESEKAKYKAEFKATFGICDGEPTNVLDLIKTIKAVNLLQ